MIVAPYREFPFLVPQTFHEFFATVNRALRSPQTQIVSISLPLGTVSPFEALARFSQPSDPHFYWEKQDVGESIAAVGCIAEQQLAGSDRFSLAQQQVNQWLASTAILGEMTIPLAGLHVFCRFTFFDHHDPTAPFPAASLFIPRWHIGCQHQRSLFVANVVQGSSAALEAQCSLLWQRYQQIGRLSAAKQGTWLETVTHGLPRWPQHGRRALGQLAGGQPKHPPLRPVFGSGRSPDLRPMNSVSPIAPVSLSPAQQHQFKQSVKAALTAIESQTISKVVLAQALDVEVRSAFRVLPSLQNLRQRHPDCHIFSTANGAGQVFLGASPERLLRIRDRTLYTEAIAGSAPRGDNPVEDAQLGHVLSSSLKELHEHQLVVNFISQQLMQLGLDPQRSPFPRLLKLRNIQHLHTPIHATLTPDLDVLEALALLHPTPAVAGVPQAAACGLIQQQEPFQRSLYAAPLGWINHRGDSEFIVGIRSALLDGSVSRLYAGAGIVHGSQPDQELSEIELKLQTLLTALLF
ncbi:MAG: isochorismate synthase MenF [Leptolyngbyaceae cyanobacterium]